MAASKRKSKILRRKFRRYTKYVRWKRGTYESPVGNLSKQRKGIRRKYRDPRKKSTGRKTGREESVVQIRGKVKKRGEEAPPRGIRASTDRRGGGNTA